MNDIDNSFLITTEIQRKWIEKFKVIRDTFKAKAEYNDQHSQFPYKNIEWLIKEGYGKLTLPKALVVKVRPDRRHGYFAIIIRRT